MTVSKFLVYGLIDPRNDQLRYIGKSCKGMRRARASSKELKEKTHKGRWLLQLNDLGIAPIIVILSECISKEEVAQKEIQIIAEHRKYGFLTNISDGGDGRPFPTGKLNPACTERVKTIIGTKNRVHFKNPVYKKLHSDLAKERWKDPSYRKKLQASSKSKYSEEVRKRIGESRKRIWQDIEYRQSKLTPVMSISKGGTRLVHISATDASRNLKIPCANICKVLSGERKTAGGYTFEKVL